VVGDPHRPRTRCIATAYLSGPRASYLLTFVQVGIAISQ
jgi:hypothetical protein